MYILFAAEGSGSAAIEIALTQCNVEYQLKPACSWESDSGRDELKQLNPLVQVPTLVLPDGTVLTESPAILIYLGLEFPASGLLSANHNERSQQLRGLAYIASNCYSAIGIMDYPQRWLANGDNESSLQLVDGARSRLYEYWDAFSDVFGSSSNWEPGRPGAPEVLACVISRWGGARDYLRASRPEFHASLVRIDQHPLVHKVVQRHWPVSE